MDLSIDLPQGVARRLATRAALMGLSLPGYVLQFLIAAGSRPTPGELAARIAACGPVSLDEPSEVTVRAIRGPLPPV